jgi:hypothetical protein
MKYKGIPVTGKLVEYHDREKTKLLKKNLSGWSKTV